MVKHIHVIGKDVLWASMRERMWHGFFILGLLFLLLTVLPYHMRNVEVFHNQSSLTNSIQLGFTFMNLFLVLISMALAGGIFTRQLKPEVRTSFLWHPLTCGEYFLGTLWGIYLACLLNWFLMVFVLWAITVIYTHTPSLYLWVGFLPTLAIVAISTGLLGLFCSILPNYMSCVLTTLFLLAGIGAGIRQGIPSADFWGGIIKVGYYLVPRINGLCGISMNLLKIFRVKVSTGGIIIHSLVFFLVSLLLGMRVFRNRLSS